MTPVHQAGTLEEGVEHAWSVARSGEAILLSPGCASFDAYDGYAARGEAFIQQIRALAGGGGSA